jgi:hypothetical protein
VILRGGADAEKAVEAETEVGEVPTGKGEVSNDASAGGGEGGAVVRDEGVLKLNGLFRNVSGSRLESNQMEQNLNRKGQQQ